MTMTITMVAISMTMMGVVVILRLMLSYHNVQLGQWELVGRQNFIIGVWNIVKGIISLYWEYFWNIEHFFQLNRITMKSFQGWCSWSRSTWRTGRCTAMSLQRSGNLPEKRSLKKPDLFLPGMEGKTSMCWVSPSGRTSTLPPARYTGSHLKTISPLLPQDFPPVGERSDDQATAHAPPRETDQKAWWWVDFSFLSKMHWYWSACLHLSSQTWKPSIIFQLLSHQCAKNWCLKWRMFPIRRLCLTPLVVAEENGNKISKTCRRECPAMSFVFVCWQ